MDGTVVESAASRWKLVQAEAAALVAAEARQAAEAVPDDPAAQQSAEAATEVARVAEQRCATRVQQASRPTPWWWPAVIPTPWCNRARTR